MRYTKFFVVLFAFTVLALTACGTDKSGGAGKLTVKNLPSSEVTYLDAFVLNSTSFPAPSGSMVGGYQRGSGEKPPYSPISLINYPLTSAFTGSGSFLVTITVDVKYVRTEKYTVAKFSNGSATIDWNAMTIKEDKE